MPALYGRRDACRHVLHALVALDALAPDSLVRRCLNLPKLNISFAAGIAVLDKRFWDGT